MALAGPWPAAQPVTVRRIAALWLVALWVVAPGARADDTAPKSPAASKALAASRPATEAEVKRGVGLIETLRTKDGASVDTALTYFCLMVLNLNEFVYLD